MNQNSLFQDLQKHFQSLLANSPAGDVQKNLSTLLAQGLSKMDLVTRDEFDQQQVLIRNLRDRVAALEKKVAELEGKSSSQANATQVSSDSSKATD